MLSIDPRASFIGKHSINWGICPALSRCLSEWVSICSVCQTWVFGNGDPRRPGIIACKCGEQAGSLGNLPTFFKVSTCCKGTGSRWSRSRPLSSDEGCLGLINKAPRHLYPWVSLKCNFSPSLSQQQASSWDLLPYYCYHLLISPPNDLASLQATEWYHFILKIIL